MRRELIIFAREPAPGRTKTRLCPPLDGTTAARLYACFLHDTLHLARQVTGVRVVIAYTPESDHQFFARLTPDIAARPQCGADLGARLNHALGRALAGGAAQVVAMGSDSPTLPVNYVRAAFAHLDGGADVVLGPTDDGGYYLIGLRSHQPRLLREVPMSTPTVLADTLTIAAELRLRVAMVPAWYDVDTASDLRRLADDLRTAPGDVAPHTRRLLADCRLHIEWHQIRR